MNKIIFFLMFALPFSVFAEERPLLNESEFLECFYLGKDIKSLNDTIRKKSRKVNEIVREADNMEERLDDLEFSLNMSETTYQICVGHGWECSAAYNTYYYNWQRYNNEINKSERLYDKEERIVADYNRKIAKEKRLLKKFRACEKVKVKRSILRKHCDNNRSNYFCSLWKY